MALTKITEVSSDHVVTFSDDLIFTFQLVPIPGSDYQAIIDAHRDDDGKASNDDVAAPMMEAGIDQAYSSVDSQPSPFGIDEAAEIWKDWPEWARWSVYNAVVAYSTRGPAADPLDAAKKKGNAAR